MGSELGVCWVDLRPGFGGLFGQFAGGSIFLKWPKPLHVSKGAMTANPRPTEDLPSHSPEPQQESQDPFADLVAEHIGWLQGWLRGRLSNEAEVEDLTQEALLRAFRNFPRLRDRSRFAPWLYRTAQNLLRDQIRRNTRRKTTLVSTEKLDSFQDGSAGRDPLERSELSARLLQAIRQLPTRYREPLLLCHAEDLSYEQIGEILGIRRDVVRVRLCRARKMLRARLGSELI